MKEIECQIEVDVVDSGAFAEELKILIGGVRKYCTVETAELDIDVCSNQAQEYETLLDIGPKDISVEEVHFRAAVIEVLNKLWEAGISTRTFHEFSVSLPHDENKDAEN